LFDSNSNWLYSTLSIEEVNSMNMKRTATVTLALLLAGLLLVSAASAATEEVQVIRYADNNYSVVEASATRNLTELQLMTNVYSNGQVYFQGPTFDPDDPWGDGGQNMILYYDHNGTYVRNMTDLVGGMNDGDEIRVQASDGMSRYFGYDNVYIPDARQGDMILAWWDDQYGFVPDYAEGIRLFFYTPPSTYGVDDSLNLTLRDMQASFDPWYSYNYSGTWPSAKGLSVKYVQYLKVYPPHRYDFNTTGDTNEWAYEGSVGATPGVNEPSGTTVTIANIANHDSSVENYITTTEDTYAAQRFVYNVTENPANIEKLNVTWIGTGTHDGGTNGADFSIWNGTSFELLQGSTSDSEVTLTGEKTSSINSYINGGNVILLIKQKGVSDGDDASTITTDYVKLVVTHHHSN